ncbi:SPOR domain-containing protein [Nitrosomonas halophila]|jgi:DedD protein|uniref:DedD protein n=1 Tax=Nitrosomonas halophila TaxID=44576 RepID=A0A1H3F1G6_9PROT|nr:SPOR domain-containing protein [Nitrosomonas halophila]SDX84667.1 DedD protein [Nitrosomonas halophila]
MVRDISEEEILLRKRARRRLIGAITLVVLAVVILPMVLDDEPKPEQQEIDILIPSENLVDDAYPWMLPEEDKSLAEDMTIAPELDKPLPFTDPDFPAVADIPPSQYPAVGGIPVPARKPSLMRPANRDQVAKETAIKKPEGAFVIQLGAFSDVSKAQQQQQNLIANGISAYTETIKIGNNEMTRVRIGPFPTRDVAETEHERLKAIGLSGVITSK